jgi:hypothetical protein
MDSADPNDMDYEEFIEENSTAMIEEMLMEEYGVSIFEQEDEVGVMITDITKDDLKEFFKTHDASEVMEMEDPTDMDFEEFIEENTTALIEEMLMEEYGEGILSKEEKRERVSYILVLASQIPVTYRVPISIHRNSTISSLYESQITRAHILRTSSGTLLLFVRGSVSLTLLLYLEFQGVN